MILSATDHRREIGRVKIQLDLIRQARLMNDQALTMLLDDLMIRRDSASVMRIAILELEVNRRAYDEDLVSAVSNPSLFE